MDFWKVLRIRRSVREFSKRLIPDNIIDSVIEAASLAPSGSNQQNWYFIIVKNNDIKEKLKKAVADRIEELASNMESNTAKKNFISHGKYFTFFSEAPVVVACVMKPYDSLTARLLKRYDKNSIYTSTAGIQSVAAAIENMLLAAASLGLGACWMTGPLIAKTSLEAILDIKPPDELLALVPIGFPKRPPVPKKHTKPLEEIMKVV